MHLFGNLHRHTWFMGCIHYVHLAYFCGFTHYIGVWNIGICPGPSLCGRFSPILLCRAASLPSVSLTRPLSPLLSPCSCLQLFCSTAESSWVLLFWKECESVWLPKSLSGDLGGQSPKIWFRTSFGPRSHIVRTSLKLQPVNAISDQTYGGVLNYCGPRPISSKLCSIGKRMVKRGAPTISNSIYVISSWNMLYV